MQFDHPFAVITPTVDGDVLAVLARADSAFTTRQVHRILDRYSYSGVRKVLERLSEQGVVDTQRYGTTDVFRLNREHLAAGPIIELAGLRATVIERVQVEIRRWRLPPVYAALFGSAARGGMYPGSDIDLFVVRPSKVNAEDQQWLEQLGQLESRVTAWTETTLGSSSTPMRVSEPCGLMNQSWSQSGPTPWCCSVRRPTGGRLSMATRSGRTVHCDANMRDGRRRKALQFYRAATSGSLQPSEQRPGEPATA